MKKILFVASEGVPFIKTGGLADVVGSLPKYFDKRYFDCRVILPKYMCMSDKVKSMMKYRTHFYLDFMGINEYVGVMETEYEGIIYYFIDNEKFFNGFKPYSDNVVEEISKFVFFSKAALSITGRRFQTGCHSLPRLADRYFAGVLKGKICRR